MLTEYVGWKKGEEEDALETRVEDMMIEDVRKSWITSMIEIKREGNIVLC